MSVTVVKEGNALRIVEADGEFPAGQKVKLFTREELAQKAGYSPLEYVQLESIFAEDEEDWGDSLAEFRLPRIEVPKKDSHA